MAHYRSPTGPGVPSGTGGDSTPKKQRSNPEWLGLVIAATITGVLGLFAGAFGGRAVGVPGPAVTATTTVTTTVTAASSPNGTGSPSSSPAKPGTVLLQKQGVQLTQGYWLSFIDPTLRPMPINSSCPGGDLSVCGGGVISSAQLAVYSGRAGFSQCQADTTYVSGYADPAGQSLTGTTLCVTTGHRLAVCYVTSDTTQATTPAPGLIMDITVYANT